MIKLAIISDDPGTGGAYKVAEEIALGLPMDSYDVQFFFLCEPSNEMTFPNGIFLGTPQFKFDYSLLDYLKLAFVPKNNQKSYLPLNKALIDFQPDLIHFHTHIIKLPLIHSLKKYFKHLIFTDHSQRIRGNELSILKTKLMGLAFKQLLSNVNTVFVSKYAFKTAITIGYGNENKDYCIENTVNSSRFTPNNLPKIKLSVVYLARINEGKGHELLLQAWELIPHTDGLELELYGIEADNGTVRNLIASTNFPNPVSYCGVTNTPEKVLQAASIGVFPSYREGMPLALLEMMASELPVVASDIPEISTIVNDKVDVFLFKCGDAKDLSEKLIAVIQDEQLRNQLGKQARITVEEKYATPLWISYQNVYKRLLNQ